MANENMLTRIVSGRTDLVFDYVSSKNTAKAKDPDGVSLIEWCAYYGDVSAMRFLLLNGESLDRLGNNLGLNGAVFHGHWQLCQFLIERGADVNLALPDSGEAPLHNALCNTERAARDRLSRFCWRTARILIALPSLARKPVPLCAIAEPGQKRPSIAPQLSGPKKQFRSPWTPGRKLTPRIWMEIHRSVGPVGIYAPMPFLGSSAMGNFEFIRRGDPCGSVCRVNRIWKNNGAGDLRS